MMDELIRQLRRDEGVRLFPYQDSLGCWTIGVGRNLSAVGISEQECEFLLANDIAKAKSALHLHLGWTASLDGCRQGALINMAFNMGIRGLMGFKGYLASLQHGQYDVASDEMLRSRWAQQVGARALRLSLQIKTGLWQ